jgi:hypothetical protein
VTAQIRIRDAAGTLRTLARIRMRDETGTLRTIQRIRIRDAGGVLRLVWQAMTVALSGSTATASAATSTITTSSVTATPSGGTAPYTYIWEGAAYNTDGIGVTTPTAATTTFRRFACASGDTYLGDFSCTVTDALGVVATSGNVAATITRT